MASETATKAEAREAADAPMIAYKAFNPDWTCRGFQFEVGKTYTHDGEVVACASGFHACVNPLDVWNYYDITDCKFAEVELSGKRVTHDEDSKIASAQITIKAELKLPDIIKRAIEWVMRDAKSGANVQAASGYSSKLAASGYSSKLAASGDYSKLAASGHYSKLAASGDYSKLAASGDSSKLAASGYYSKLAASGYYSKLAASGDYSKLAASGHYSKLAASGHYSKLDITGKDGVASAASPNSIARGVAGTWISLAEFDRNGKCIGFATGCVGADSIPENTWLKASGGKLVAA